MSTCAGLIGSSAQCGAISIYDTDIQGQAIEIHIDSV